MFWKRLLSGIVLLSLAIAGIYIGGTPLAELLWAVSLIAFHELAKAMRCTPEDKKISGIVILGYLGITAYYALLPYGIQSPALLLAIVCMFMAFMFLYVVTFPKYRIEQIAGACFSYIYAPILLSFIYLVRESEGGFYLVWLILIISCGCDTFAYAVGMLIGKKKIFPKLSPKKSLEGCIGGVLGTTGLGWLYGHFFLERYAAYENTAWMVALICALGAVFSMIGDLAASAIKRNQEMKDYGKLIPGHGGIMDRMDSVIVTAPMVYILVLLTLN